MQPMPDRCNSRAQPTEQHRPPGVLSIAYSGAAPSELHEIREGAAWRRRGCMCEAVEAHHELGIKYFDPDCTFVLHAIF